MRGNYTEVISVHADVREVEMCQTAGVDLCGGGPFASTLPDV